MNNRKIEKLKVVFVPNTEPVEQVVTDALITQLMVTLTRVGLREDHLGINDAIIRKGTGYGY